MNPKGFYNLLLATIENCFTNIPGEPRFEENQERYKKLVKETAERRIEFATNSPIIDMVADTAESANLQDAKKLRKLIIEHNKKLI